MRAWIAGAALAVFTLAGCGGGPVVRVSQGAAKVTPVQTAGIQTLAPPLTVAQVAGIVGAVRPTDCGASPLTGVTDGGYAEDFHGYRIGIAIFPSPDIRDGWKKMSASFGVVSLEQGFTWVIYKALTQHGPDC